MAKMLDATTAYRFMQAVASEMDREAPITQALAFLRIAAAGEAGIDQGKLQDELKVSSAGISRTVQALSKVHWNKEKEGFDLVERIFDPLDNRRRALRLTSKGERAMERIGNSLRK